MKEPNKFHIYETEKITRKASDTVEENLSSCSVLSPEIVMHEAFNVIRLNVRRYMRTVVHDDLGVKEPNNTL